VRVFIGYDPREAVAYHTCVQSIIEHCGDPSDLQITPLSGERRDGSNDFIYARFLVPYLCGFKGCAVFLDGDMIVRGDIRTLYDYFRPYRGVHVVKHDYKTKFPVKYLGNKNEDYPRKNWSSVVVWNCGFFPNRKLMPDFVSQQAGSFLHRFLWLKDEQIGELPAEWNRLVLEQEVRPQDRLLHFTVGIPPLLQEVPNVPPFSSADAEWELTRIRANRADPA
jgi:hypothetical protein